MLIVSQRIAVVDDDPSILRALRRLLGAVGFTVNTFGSGEELLAWEGLGTIDCLILDVHLAGLSGFDVEERLTDVQPSLPIVFITAHDDEATRDRARTAANAPYLRKPFDEHGLVQAIPTALVDAGGGRSVTLLARAGDGRPCGNRRSWVPCDLGPIDHDGQAGYIPGHRIAG